MPVKFSSPREEALDIALQTRKDVLQGKIETVQIVRSCYIISNILKKKEDEKWLRSELSGYYEGEEVPSYRKLYSNVEKNSKYINKNEIVNVYNDVHYIEAALQDKERTNLRYEQINGSFNVIHERSIRKLLNNIIDRCVFFLNDIILELQYGGVVEFLMEEIRKNTDEKMINLDPLIGDEINSLIINLTSTNPADWNKVGHSCRKILQLVADQVFPASDKPYQCKDGKIRDIRNDQYINRLYAYIDKECSGDERQFNLIEVNLLESYLRSSIKFDNMGEHKPSIEKYQADLMVIHTYLIISEILRHYKK